MKTTKELNKALSELYSGLENLQSAREQVEIVTSSSKDLSESTSTLLLQLRAFSNQFGEKYSSNVSQLTQSLESFENKINSISKKGDQSISEYIENFKNQTTTVIDQIHEKNSSNASQITQSLEKFENKINSISKKWDQSISEYIELFKSQIVVIINQISTQISENEKKLTAINNLNNIKISEKIEQFDKTTKDLKTNAEDGINDIKNIALSEISKIIQNAQETNSKIEKLIDVITNYDIPKSIELINQKLELQTKENRIIKISLFVILGLVIICMLMLFILVVSKFKRKLFF